MKISIRHQLRLSVGGGNAHAVEHLLLTPVSGPTQTVRDWAIEIAGVEDAARFVDAFGNRALLVAQSKPEAELLVSVTGTVETIDRAGVLGRVTGEPVIALYRRVTEATKPDAGLLAEFATADRHGPARIALFHAIMGRIGEMYRFGGAIPAGDSGPDAQSQTLGNMTQTQSAAGQSQAAGAKEPDERPEADAATFAQLFIGIVRALEIPARYVTGYLAGDDEQPAAFHAWAEAHDDGLGWIGFDAALGICPTDRHVRLAAGLDASSTAPVRVVPQDAEPALVAVEIAAQ